MTKIKFSFEVPLKHLEDFHEDQDFLFTLSMLYESDDYTRYIKKHRDNHTLWLDNSYNEKLQADSLDQIISLYNAIKPDLVISPDAPDWPIEKLRTIYLEAAKHIPQEKLVLVVPNYRCFIRLWMDIHPHRVAVSYWVRRSWYPEELRRMCERCATHYLGLLSPHEFLDTKPLSCDTSIPIKLALRGMTLKDWLNNHCQHIDTASLGFQGKDYFKAEMTTKEIDLAKANIQALKEVASS